MNVILIDDDHSTVEMLQTTISWNTLGIDKILTAYNIQQAKSLFQEIAIDIMICDIEMPNGTGIELLEWLRNRNSNVKTIFLTNHAEFNFAQQAIKLESIDFILKMSSIEVIEAALRRAVNIVKTIEITNRYLDYGHQWENSRGLFSNKFWHDLCIGKKYTEKAKILLDAKKYGINIDFHIKSIIIYITASRSQEALQDWNHTETDFCMANISSEVLFNDSNSSYIINLEKDNKVALAAICHPGVISFQMADIKNMCQELSDLYRKIMNCHVHFYISEPCYCEQFPDTLIKLEELDNNNVDSTQIIMWNTEESSNYNLIEKNTNIDFEELYPLLLTGQTVLLISKVKEFFMIAQEQKLGSQFTCRLSQHYNQILYTAIKEKNLEFNCILEGERELLLYNHSTKSVYDLLKWITISATRFSNELQNQKQPPSVITEVEKYIDENFQNRITKSEIAHFVYLNPDYLAKFFKKETGILLSDYINQVRIEKSKPLLNDLSISLSDVSAMVGFDYYSYYSTIFKKNEGITPKEYRAGNLSKMPRYS